MGLKDLDIKKSYISCGDENIAKSFLVPALKHTKLYQRSVGFFSSSVFEPILDGVVALARNGGNIQLIASPRLNEEDAESIADEQEEFRSLWDGTNPFVKVYPYRESAKANLLTVLERKQSGSGAKSNAPIQLRDYQKEAITAWVNNDYHGFYVMATGTGKTWTAIYSAKELLEKHPAMVVICAPYKHLVRQWADDVVKSFPDAKLIMVSSENPQWEQQINHEVIRRKRMKHIWLRRLDTRLCRSFTR